MESIRLPEFVVLPSQQDGTPSKYFIKKKYIQTTGTKKETIEQWWLYGLNRDGLYEPIVGTNELDIEEARKVFYEELTK